MNIVKGVADLIRRTSNIQSGESSTRSTTEKFPAPAPKICFSEEGDEAILHTLWEKHESITDKVEKRKLFHVFLKQFVAAFKSWVPVNAGPFIETTPTTNATESPLCRADVVVSCFVGHPVEIILTLIEEIGHITTLIADLNPSGTHGGIDVSQWPSWNVSAEGLPVLDALTIITRSMHNCRVFGFYSGVQKLTALLKAQRFLLIQRCTGVRRQLLLSWRLVALIELLRVIRRLSLKEQWTDISLQYLTLKILHIALVENPREMRTLW
ncbi:unnamed protein product [Linum trigynum]|uniref:Uncharacterized protein n=1 Tax=Linum trigynum TaxID=586398 RepID=A0AAV2FBZ8_9ROSI